jgi:hypothetical protein
MRNGRKSLGNRQDPESRQGFGSLPNAHASAPSRHAAEANEKTPGDAGVSDRVSTVIRPWPRGRWGCAADDAAWQPPGRYQTHSTPAEAP